MNIDSLLPEVKQIELEILDIVDKFCKENDITYSLAYGTLLGAVRHKGFIPWDDDIDLFMPREDYEKFINLWNKKPVNGYLLMTPETDPDYTQTFAKIRKDHTTFLQKGEEKYNYHKGIFIDIFPCDRTANNKFNFRIQKIDAMLMLLFTRKYPPAQNSAIIQFFCKLLLRIVPKRFYYKARRFFCKKFISKSSADTGFIDAAAFTGFARIFPDTMFDECVELDFENRKYSAIAEWDNILKQVYGNYMEYPPESERTWKHHPIFIDFEHNYEEIKNE